MACKLISHRVQASWQKKQRHYWGQLVLLQGQGLEQSSTSAPLSDQLDLETLGPEGEVLRGSIALIDKLFETLASPIATNASLTN